MKPRGRWQPTPDLGPLSEPVDTKALRASAVSVGNYHNERGKYGGASWEFHARAETTLSNAFAAAVHSAIDKLSGLVSKKEKP